MTRNKLDGMQFSCKSCDGLSLPKWPRSNSSRGLKPAIRVAKVYLLPLEVDLRAAVLLAVRVAMVEVFQSGHDPTPAEGKTCKGYACSVASPCVLHVDSYRNDGMIGRNQTRLIAQLEEGWRNEGVVSTGSTGGRFQGCSCSNFDAA